MSVFRIISRSVFSDVRLYYTHIVSSRHISWPNSRATAGSIPVIGIYPQGGWSLRSGDSLSFTALK